MTDLFEKQNTISVQYDTEIQLEPVYDREPPQVIINSEVIEVIPDSAITKYNLIKLKMMILWWVLLIITMTAIAISEIKKQTYDILLLLTIEAILFIMGILVSCRICCS